MASSLMAGLEPARLVCQQDPQVGRAYGRKGFAWVRGVLGFDFIGALVGYSH